MRRDHEESWLADGTIRDAISEMRDRMDFLMPLNARFTSCRIEHGPFVTHGVEGPWQVTIEYEAEDEG